jgi:hypothetical protein
MKPKILIILHTRQRPGDIFVPEFDNYGDAYLDVSVINITRKSHLAKASKGLLMGADIRYVVWRNQEDLMWNYCLLWKIKSLDLRNLQMPKSSDPTNYLRNT